ncbi:protein kinase [Skermanella mucosa]|uniref:serine/threonine-protein kinase n=1 Tax=Skermanella mucosa TaxID=1789672 RepID=UPI00192B9492|nr:serine/threonine-protein kinase [Skermanella mucosa]UEM23094.1 protein kinase [Skermanella mucosa]
MSIAIHKTGDIVADRYEVISYVGEGGMQQVFRAKDLSLKRIVAVKTPKNNTAQKRFKRSAIVSARINHPNVAKTLDYLSFQDRDYLVEEFIDGRDLKIVLTNEIPLLDPYLSARVLHYLSKGLAASHHVDVVHRDLKPSNIMVVGGHGLSQVKITDFGIAKLAEDELAEAKEGGDASITGSQTMVGALPYMSPEMIESPRDAGKPADVWALGAMMYELMSGKKPFGSSLKAIHAIIEAKPPAIPPEISANSQMSLLGKELFSIVSSCLQKDEASRPTADSLVSQCEQLCYSMESREIGVLRVMQRPTYGFIQDASGHDVFFHVASVYGRQPAVGEKVSFARFPGGEADRAHPVIALRLHS